MNAEISTLSRSQEVDMRHGVLEQEILSTLAKLAPSQQRQVLDFVRSLTLTPIGVSGQSLLVFAGTIAQDELKRMEDAIDIDCEQIHAHEW